MKRNKGRVISILMTAMLILTFFNVPASVIESNAEGEVIEWTLGYQFNKGDILRKGTVIKNRWEYWHKPAGYDYKVKYYDALSIGYCGLEHLDELFGEASREMKRTDFTYNDAGEKNGEIWEQVSETNYTIPFDSVVVEYEEPTWVSGEAGNSGITAAGLTLMPVCELSIYKYYLENNIPFTNTVSITCDSGSIEQLTADYINEVTGNKIEDYVLDVVFFSSEDREQAKKWKDEGVYYYQYNEETMTSSEMPVTDGTVTYIHKELIINNTPTSTNLLEFPTDLVEPYGKKKINHTTEWEILGFTKNEERSNDTFGCYTLYIVSKDGAPHEHEYTEWKYTDSYHYRECKSCEARDLDKADHIIERKVTKMPTETEKGEFQDVCSVCGYVSMAQEISLEDYKAIFPEGQGSEQQGGSGSGGQQGGSGSGEGSGGTSQGGGSAGNATTYSNEWVNGKWYNENGVNDYEGELTWKSNSTGWWVEDTAGWYPQDSWWKIDGDWYYFKPDGYMASGEYYNGYWLNDDGTWDDKYQLSWKSNSTGWWVEDISGWWPSSQWLKINGNWYYFGSDGYMVTSQYVDGYWIGADGVSP